MYPKIIVSYAERYKPPEFLIDEEIKNMELFSSDIVGVAQAKAANCGLAIESFVLAEDGDKFKNFIDELEKAVGQAPTLIIVLALVNGIKDWATIGSYLNMLRLAERHCDRALQANQDSGLSPAEIIFNALNDFGRNNILEKYDEDDITSNLLPNYLDRLINFFSSSPENRTDSQGQCRSLSLFFYVVASDLGVKDIDFYLIETVDEDGIPWGHATTLHNNELFESTSVDPSSSGLWERAYLKIRVSPYACLLNDSAQKILVLTEEIIADKTNEEISDAALANQFHNLLQQLKVTENILAFNYNEQPWYTYFMLAKGYKEIANLRPDGEERINDCEKVINYSLKYLQTFIDCDNILPEPAITQLLKSNIIGNLYDFYVFWRDQTGKSNKEVEQVIDKIRYKIETSLEYWRTAKPE
ncbi:hypothetical protein NO2_0804 [Candidatus Termititenax persephonae]|uniref:Uncharacterized protein n=1 Tax=Candidatus Termititenax persephonae TaxID=2218525 RepID=A0A388TGI2_9BACT|nr:hypothetical protein NO2_0804 [Candidatus Termititenax persephonae]